MNSSRKREMRDRELIDAIREGNDELLKKGLRFAFGSNKYKPTRKEFFERNKGKWKRIVQNGGTR